MIYLAWYLGIGVVLLAAMLIAHALKKKDESPFLQDMLDAALPERKTLRYRILNNLVAPALAGIFVLAAWPVAMLLLIKELLQDRIAAAAAEEREFAVRQGELLERMTIPEIEQREKVIDPLGAVPDLPFGHLHAAWALFLQEIGPDDALWSFTSTWTADWGHKELRSGYVLVRGNVPGPYFLTLRKNLD